MIFFLLSLLVVVVARVFFSSSSSRHSRTCVSDAVHLHLKNTQHFLAIYTVSDVVCFFSLFLFTSFSQNVYKIHASSFFRTHVHCTRIRYVSAIVRKTEREKECMCVCLREKKGDKAGRRRNEFSIFYIQRA